MMIWEQFAVSWVKWLHGVKYYSFSNNSVYMDLLNRSPLTTRQKFVLCFVNNEHLHLRLKRNVVERPAQFHTPKTEMNPSCMLITTTGTRCLCVCVTLVSLLFLNEHAFHRTGRLENISLYIVDNISCAGSPQGFHTLDMVWPCLCLVRWHLLDLQQAKIIWITF